jgi:hypothetical protein
MAVPSNLTLVGHLASASLTRRAQALRFITCSDDDRGEGQTDFQRYKLTMMQAERRASDMLTFRPSVKPTT